MDNQTNAIDFVKAKGGGKFGENHVSRISREVSWEIDTSACDGIGETVNGGQKLLLGV